MRLTGGALRRLEEITPEGMTARLDVTLTDEPPLAQAVVIITAVPAQERGILERAYPQFKLVTRAWLIPPPGPQGIP